MARAVVPLLLQALVACSSSSPAPTAAAGPTTTAVPATPTAPPSTVAPTVTSSTVPAFDGVAVRVTAADLPSSWRPGCPVGPENLRRLELSYWGFDDRPHTGALVVHAEEAQAVIGVFRRLYDKRFPIRRMEPIDAFGGSDEASTAADNTAAFNCRNAVASGPPTWSAHAYGRAIDVNPVENPYILDGEVLPPAGAEYRDRSNVRPGMAVRGGELVAAFAAAGWSWGGGWANPDYQHFSATGS
ncbi:MAG TPA: M15 family metallopeptidase [Acidimicrobiales bacterium]|nr:M15 family metallopeptidase [Acidimicrobiales bacterium]